MNCLDNDIEEAADSSGGRGGPQSFASLGPDEVLTALEAIGIRCDGRLQALNSFENRVYLVGLEDGGSCVAKFYRPGRWLTTQILEEHRFAHELTQAEIPVVAPDVLAGGSTLAEGDGFRFAVYPRQGGRTPELDNTFHGPAMRDRIGQFIGRIHNVGARAPFEDRPAIDPGHTGTSRSPSSGRAVCCHPTWRSRGSLPRASASNRSSSVFMKRRV